MILSMYEFQSQKASDLIGGGKGGGGVQTSQTLPVDPPLDKDPELRGCFKNKVGPLPTCFRFVAQVITLY